MDWGASRIAFKTWQSMPEGQRVEDPRSIQCGEMRSSAHARAVRVSQLAQPLDGRDCRGLQALRKCKAIEIEGALSDLMAKYPGTSGNLSAYMFSTGTAVHHPARGCHVQLVGVAPQVDSYHQLAKVCSF